MSLSAPFPYFGGKSRAAPEIWQRLGDVDSYVEPFCGSLAVLLARPHAPRTETVNDADKFLCLAPQTRLLDSNFRWVEAGSVYVGQELIGFDEANGSPREGLRAPKSYRRWQITRVTAVRRTTKPCYRLGFSDGTQVVASADHLWLGGSHKSGGRGWRWVRTDRMVCNRATQRSWVLKLCDVVEPDTSYETGWLAGFLDGEGNLKRAPGWRVTVSQKLGPEADRAETAFERYGLKTHRAVRSPLKASHQPVACISVNGGMRSILRLLMAVRPERLIQNCKAFLPTVSLYGREHQAVSLVSKEFLGDQEVVAVETESHTFIAEGLASHNCNFWRAVKAAPVEVAEWADWPVNEADLEARHYWLVTKGRDRLADLMGNPEGYDAKVAGWWVWGACAWIGSGWCSGEGPWRWDGEAWVDRRQLPHLSEGRGINRQLPHLSEGRGINRKLPHLSEGRGINRQLPRLSGDQGINRQLPYMGTWRGFNARQGEAIAEWMSALSVRLRMVRVACGDWSRVCGDSITTGIGTCGVLLDPPYSAADRAEVYNNDCFDVAHKARAWAIERGSDPRMRIAFCGYAGEFAEPWPAGWTEYAWKAKGGYAGQGSGENVNAKRERVWFSPHCLSAKQADIFARYLPHGEQPAENETVSDLAGHHGAHARLAVRAA